MTINNALASVAVKDIKAAAQGYEKVIGRPADSTPVLELAELKFEVGGWLQVYALPERAGSCSCTLTVANINRGKQPGSKKTGCCNWHPNGRASQFFMVKDPDGNNLEAVFRG